MEDEQMKMRQDICGLFCKLSMDLRESECQRTHLCKKLEESGAENKKLVKELQNSEAQKNDLKQVLERSAAEKKELLKVLEQREMQLQQLNDMAYLEKKKANALVVWLAEEYKKCLAENEKLDSINIGLESQLEAMKKRLVELKIGANEFRAELRKREEELADFEAEERNEEPQRL